MISRLPGRLVNWVTGRPTAADLAPNDVLAASQLALDRLGVGSGQLGVAKPPLVSNNAVIHFLGRPGAPPLYVVKMPARAYGRGKAADQFAAVQRCYAWWEAEDRHSVARPVALLPEADGFLMQYAPGPGLASVLSQAVLQPETAMTAAAAAGDFLRRFHLRGGAVVDDVEISDLVAGIRALQAADLKSAGVSLPDAVERILDKAGRGRLPTRRVLLHGDYAPRNLILSGHGQVTMIDPVLKAEGPVEDDIATFLTMISSASAFAGGLVLPRIGALRVRLQERFLTAYGVDDISPLLFGLKLIHKQMRRWAYRRSRALQPFENPLAMIRGHLIDAQMLALLNETAAGVDGHIAMIRSGRSRLAVRPAVA